MSTKFRKNIYLLFSATILPTIHLFTSAAQKLVPGYCNQTPETTYSENRVNIDGGPWKLPWNGKNVFLIFSSRKCSDRFYKKVLKKVKCDKTECLVIGILGKLSAEVHLILVQNSAIAVHLLEVEGSIYSFYFLSGKSITVPPQLTYVHFDPSVVEKNYSNRIGLHLIPFPLLEAFVSSVTVGISEGVFNHVDESSMFWHNWKVTNLLGIRMINRETYMSPLFAGDLYIPEKISLTIPSGVQRFETALPLPSPHTDKRSLRIMEEAIKPNLHLFSPHTVIDIDHFEKFCSGLGNDAHCNSYIAALRHGGNPWVAAFEDDVAVMKDAKLPCLSELEQEFIHKQRNIEVAAGRWSPAFSHKIPYMRTCSYSTTPKPNSDKLRFIQNLSAPRGFSYNDHISKADAALKLDTISEMVRMMRYYKSNQIDAQIWIVDIQAFFRHFPLHPLVSLRTCIKIRNEDGTYSYHVDKCACFGGRSNPRYCSDWGDIIIAGLYKKFGVLDAYHYIDDFWGMCELNNSVPRSMQVILDVFKYLGVPVSDKNQSGYSAALLGLLININTGTISLCLDKAMKYLSNVRFHTRKWDGRISLADLQKIAGQLSWCTSVVPIGKVFNRALYALSKKFGNDTNPNRSVKMTQDATQALIWWDSVLSSNPCRFVHEELKWDLAEADDIIFTDASTSCGLGIYMPKGQMGYYHDFESSQSNLLKEQHINVLELLAIVVAVKFYASPLGRKHKKRLVILSDNSTACSQIANMDADNAISAKLLRILSSMLVSDVDLRTLHIPGEINPADHLSRGKAGLLKAKATIPLKYVTSFDITHGWVML